MKKACVAALALIILILATTTARADLILTVGDHNLLPNLSGQTIQIFARNESGTVTVEGLDLGLQVEDGFPDVSGSSSNGPNITGIDLINGTIFENNHQSPTTPTQTDQTWLKFITTDPNIDSGLVTVPNTDSLLATVTIDTTGFSTIGSSFSLSASGIQPGSFDSEFFANPSTSTSVVNGSLTITPEPSSFFLMAVGASAVYLARRRRFASRKAA